MMQKQNKVRMDYLYRKEWKKKNMTMNELWQQVKDGKYLRLVKGVRGEDAVATRAGLGIKDVAANDLPKIWPAWETDGTYTGRVLLSLRIADDGQLFRWLRQRVVMRYSLPDGTFPTEEQARKLFQQYAFRRACDFMQAATGVKAEDDEHYGTGWFRISADPDAYWNAEPAAIPMSQPLKPLTEHICCSCSAISSRNFMPTRKSRRSVLQRTTSPFPAKPLPAWAHWKSTLPATTIPKSITCGMSSAR